MKRLLNFFRSLFTETKSYYTLTTFYTNGKFTSAYIEQSANGVLIGRTRYDNPDTAMEVYKLLIL